MMLLGYLCGGWIMAQASLKATELLEAGGGDTTSLETKQKTAQFYFDHLLPRAESCLTVIKSGSDSIMALEVEQF